MEQIIQPFGGMGHGEFSPDGLQFATAGHTAAKVWDVTTGEEAIPALTHDGAVITVAFSQDETRIITASLDKTARIWDRATGQPFTPPLIHDREVIAGFFSRCNRWAATLCTGGHAHLWDARTGERVGPLFGMGQG
jgi:WD40 repeat protein